MYSRLVVNIPLSPQHFVLGMDYNYVLIESLEAKNCEACFFYTFRRQIQMGDQHCQHIQQGFLLTINIQDIVLH